MSCRQEKIDLALLAGQDLENPVRREELRRHMAACPGCRIHFQRLQSSLRILERADTGRTTYEREDSLWPELAARLGNPARPSGPTARFNGWVPFAAMTAACLLMLTVIFNDRSPQPAAPSQPPMASNVLGPVTSWPRTERARPDRDERPSRDSETRRPTSSDENR